MANVHDPVALGFVASLARPGGNVTGLATLTVELGSKNLELLREVLPRLSSVAVVVNPANLSAREFISEVDRTASAMNVKVIHFEARSLKELEHAISGAFPGKEELEPNPAQAIPDRGGWASRRTARRRGPAGGQGPSNWLPIAQPGL